MTDGLALSALDWWSAAGVDTLVDDAPRDWLAAAPAVTTPASALTPTPAPALPADLAAFRRWLLADAGVPGPAAARLDAAGDPASGTMVVLDMPEPQDRAAGSLLAGETGALFDRMLGAMTLDRATIYLAPFSPARPASGRLDAASCATLAGLLRHHLALVRPRRLLLMGDAPTRALTGLALPRARGAVHSIDFAGGAVPAVASFQPALLREKPGYKAEAWADLQRFMAL